MSTTSASSSSPSFSFPTTFGSTASPSALASASSCSRVGCLASRVLAVTLFTPGVTETFTSSAVRLASSFLPARAWVVEFGPMNLRPAFSMVATNSSSSAMKP